jgi:alpha-ribazole phosphatase
MNRLVLIRHGRTDGSDRRLYYGATDLPVNEAGLRELKARAGEYPSCEGFRVLTTGYLRTEQTLRAICGEVPHEAAPELGEIRFGIFEMKSYDELKNRADYQTWLAGDWMANVPPGGESFNMAQSRVRRALEGLLRRPEDVYAVVHGGTIITIMQQLFPEIVRSSYEWLPQPGFGYEADLKNHKFRAIPG